MKAADNLVKVAAGLQAAAGEGIAPSNTPFGRNRMEETVESQVDISIPVSFPSPRLPVAPLQNQ